MQQLSVHDYYDLGKKIDGIEREIAKAGDEGIPKRGIAWSLFILRWKLDEIIKEPCALLPASQRAARAVIKSINVIAPENMDDIFNIDKTEMIHSYQLSSLGTNFKNFETVLKKGNYWFGKTFTEEHRANLSKNRKGKPRATPMSAETKAKLSALAQARWDERRSNPDSSRSIGKPVGPRSKSLTKF